MDIAAAPPWAGAPPLFDAAAVAMAMADVADGRLSRVNPRFADMLGEHPLALSGRHLADLAHADDREAHLQAFRSLVEGGSDEAALDLRLVRSDGSAVWVLMSLGLLRGADDRPRCVLAVAMDIADRRAHEQARRAAAKEERRRLSADLHDTLGQHLAAIAMAVRAIGEQPDIPAAVREQVRRLQEMVRGLDDDVDRLVHALRPSLLESLGLEEALRSHIGAWNRDHAPQVDLQARGLSGRRLPQALETTVFRIVQEALNNVARHARATHVGVIVERHERELRAIVEDDGVGFDPATVESSAAGRHFGLRGMRDRATAAGGTIEIESRPGQGTTLFLSLPL